MRIGDLRKAIHNLPDDFEIELTARQRLSIDEQLDFKSTIPYMFENTELTFNEIDLDNKKVYMECEIPSPFFFLDN